MPTIQPQHAARSGGSSSPQVDEPPPSDGTENAGQRRLAGPADTSPPRRPRARTAFVVAMVVAVLAGTGSLAVAVKTGAAPTAGQPAPPPSGVSPTSVPTLTNQLPVPTPEVPSLPPASDCVPAQLGCAPATTTPACVGEDCLPVPPTSPPDPDTPDPGGESGQDEAPECGLTDPAGCVAVGINTAFSGLVQAALSPILELLAATALSTPRSTNSPVSASYGRTRSVSWSLSTGC